MGTWGLGDQGALLGPIRSIWDRAWSRKKLATVVQPCVDATGVTDRCHHRLFQTLQPDVEPLLQHVDHIRNTALVPTTASGTVAEVEGVMVALVRTMRKAGIAGLCGGRKGTIKSIRLK